MSRFMCVSMENVGACRVLTVLLVMSRQDSSRPVANVVYKKPLTFSDSWHWQIFLLMVFTPFTKPNQKWSLLQFSGEKTCFIMNCFLRLHTCYTHGLRKHMYMCMFPKAMYTYLGVRPTERDGTYFWVGIYRIVPDPEGSVAGSALVPLSVPNMPESTFAAPGEAGAPLLGQDQASSTASG